MRTMRNACWTAFRLGGFALLVGGGLVAQAPAAHADDAGVTWTARAAAEANNWTSVTYGNGLFVAVASTGTNQVMTSPDGVTWTARAAAEPNLWFSVTYGNGRFVAVAFDGTHRVMTSQATAPPAASPPVCPSTQQSSVLGSSLLGAEGIVASLPIGIYAWWRRRRGSTALVGRGRLRSAHSWAILAGAAVMTLAACVPIKAPPPGC